MLEASCSLHPLNETVINECKPFTCGNNDLDDFFKNDAENYAKQLIGKSYCFRLETDLSTIICAFTLSNSKIKVKGLDKKRKIVKNIPHRKSLEGYPAVLIGRLGINIEHQRQGVGDELLDFIKSWFANSTNKTGCRFIIVDALNEDGVLRFYIKNGFDFIFRDDDEEKKHNGIKIEGFLRTKSMYYDLLEMKVGN
ncbi:hypothetical protein EZS27_009380 [termite gut metagenome]|uniref:N-acetyltransferase domain-containing protein n=1 Tax=termite gut metagenome TaxID=433724 RepID=A0A5J4SC53_9ZZZZ